MSNNINTMQICCYINHHGNNTKIKSIQSELFQCLFYTSKALNLGHLVKVLRKYLNNTNAKGSPLCDVLPSFVSILFQFYAPHFPPFLLPPSTFKNKKLQTIKGAINK